jgi:hypothetical protein
MRKLQLGSQWILWSCAMSLPIGLVASPAAAQSGAGPVPEAAPTTEPAPEAAPTAEAPGEPTPAPVEEPAPPAAEPTPAEADVGAAVQFGPSSSSAAAAANGDVPGEDADSAGPRSMENTSSSVAGPATASADEWKFSYNGYFRAPMRIGIGERANAKTDQATTTFGQPKAPDDQYLFWQYTKQNQRSWAEMFFGYGSKRAKGTLALGAFNFTDSTYNNQDAQAGITQGWVTLNPDMMDIDEDMRLQVKVGSFWGRYGGMGRYDAGAYDTFIFGRTHVMGEDVRMEYDLDETVLWVEQGFGTKEPNPDPNHNTKFTLLAHLHAGFNYDEFVEVGAHLLHAWTQEPDHECFSREEEWAVQDAAGIEIQAEFSEAPVGACKQEDPSSATASSFARADSPDGSMTVFGADAVFNTSGLGRFYIGASRVMGDKAVTVAEAIEVIHAYGGGFFNMGITHQYFLERQDWEPQTLADQMSTERMAEYRRVRNDRGNGTIDTIAGQWDLSLATLIGAEVLGQQQLDLKLFGMLNLVKSEDDPQLANISKLKFGTELLYSPLSWFGVGGRFDRVAPRSDIPEQTFMAVGPRMVFRTNFATHEEINIGFAHYIYNQRECQRTGNAPITGSDLLYCVQPPGGAVGPAGFGYRPGVNASKRERGAPVEESSATGPFPDKGWDPPDLNTLYISASMWW